MIELKFERIFPDAYPPRRAFPDDAGIDLSAYLISESKRPINRMIPPRDSTLITTGLRVQPPPGCMLLVLSRSGMAKENSVFVANAPGLIDPGYRGELKVILYNGGAEPFYIAHGDRIAQLIVQPVYQCELFETKIIDDTDRGGHGFGSTGR